MRRHKSIRTMKLPFIVRTISRKRRFVHYHLNRLMGCEVIICSFESEMVSLYHEFWFIKNRNTVQDWLGNFPPPSHLWSVALILLQMAAYCWAVGFPIYLSLVSTTTLPGVQNYWNACEAIHGVHIYQWMSENYLRVCHAILPSTKSLATG